MSNFDRITETPEALAAFLAALPIANGPWDQEFHAQYCADCLYLGCDSCPHSAQRNNPLWWLNLEAEAEKQERGGLEGLREVRVKATQEQAAELWRMIQEDGPGMIVSLTPEEVTQDAAEDYEAEWNVVPGPGGWMIGWFTCGKCGGRSATDEEICPHCKSKMKKIKW